LLFERIGVVVDWELIDETVVSDANIMRPVKGHAFEFHIDEIFKNILKHPLESGNGGDTDVDRHFLLDGNDIELQIKTPVTKSIKEGKPFAVNLHKTHGEEVRPINLYPMQWPCPICHHNGEAFPEFLVIQHPKNGILIVPKDEIPEDKSYPGHYADPAYFEWDSEWLNRWDLLGFPEYKGKQLERRSVPTQKKLPRIAEIVNLTDEEIVEMWLMPENFRTLEMNLKGNLREPAMANWAKEKGVKLNQPTGSYPKYDKVTDDKVKIQIKGVSKGFVDLEKNRIGTEVMGTHGKGMIRTYSETDFDYLGLVIEPMYISESMGLSPTEYHFCFIPSSSLPLHHRNEEWEATDRLYPICKFNVVKTRDGKIGLVPADNYRLKIEFRGSGPWIIDEIPEDIK